MRIIGEISHPQLKITVFKMDNKLSVKFEAALMEQTYKYRTQEGLEEFKDVQRLVNDEFIHNVLKTFRQMQKTQFDALREIDGEEEFETII